MFFRLLCYKYNSGLQFISLVFYSFGIDEQSESVKNFRLNVLHMYGVENMTTKDIFKYFEDYAPASIEWISEVACKLRKF